MYTKMITRIEFILLIEKFHYYLYAISREVTRFRVPRVDNFTLKGAVLLESKIVEIFELSDEMLPIQAIAKGVKRSKSKVGKRLR